MRLEGSNGSVVELTVTGHQFPTGLDLPSGRHIEPDWLTVEGRVATDGRAWQWSYPCLRSDEAVELGNWLEDVARRENAASRISFTEPNLAIEVITLVDRETHLRFRLSQEACPPDEPDEVRLGDGYLVLVTIHTDLIIDAVESWRREIAPFPAR